MLKLFQYRDPAMEIIIFLDNLSFRFSELDLYKYLFVLGVFNFHFNNKNSQVLEITNWFCSMKLVCFVYFLIRVKSCLDNIFISTKQWLIAKVGLIEHIPGYIVTAKSYINYRIITDAGLLVIYNRI